jgi:hypothetical protein
MSEEVNGLEKWQLPPDLEASLDSMPWLLRFLLARWGRRWYSRWGQENLDVFIATTVLVGLGVVITVRGDWQNVERAKWPS